MATSKTQWSVRLPSIHRLEDVLNESEEAGWDLQKISEPLNGREGIYFVVIFNRTILEGETNATNTGLDVHDSQPHIGTQ